MKRILSSKPILLGLSGLFILGGCMTVPETGRKELMLISGDQEVQLGLTSFNDMKKQVPISQDAAAQAMVERVGKRIAAVAQLPNANWEFVLFESKEANAFCLPGGKVGVYTGILPITQNEAGLATVLGHEVSHAVARHGAARMSRELVMQTVGQYAESKITDQTKQAIFNKVYGVGTTIGLELPHDRKQEAEADHIGLLYMARAGYDPQEAVRFWQRFKEFNQKANPGGGGLNDLKFLRTHPLDDDRIKALQEELPAALREYNNRKPM